MHVKNLDKMFNIQKWAISTTANSHYRGHTEPLFLKLNVINVHDTFKLNLGTIIIITQISFHQFFQRILLNMFKHTITQQEMPKITDLIVQLKIVDLIFGILWTKLLNITKPSNTSEIS